jgi:TPR repeat protein
MHNMAMHYREGLGVPHNDARAFEWALAAAHLHFAPSQHLVGVALHGGWGPGEVAAAASLAAHRAAGEGRAWL